MLNRSEVERRQHPVSRWLRIGFRVVVALILALILWQMLDREQLRTAYLRFEWQWALLALMMPPCAVLLSAVRWNMLLKTQAINLPFSVLLRFYLRSQFFMVVFPSFLGADAGRVWDMRQQTQQTAKSLSSVLLERLCGLHVMTLFGLLAVWLTPWMADYPAVRVLTTLLFVGITAAGIILLQPRLAQLVQAVVPAKYGSRFRHSIEEVIAVYREYPMILLQTWLLSGLIQVCTLLAVYFQIQTLGYNTVSLSDAITIAPLIAIIAVIPLSPGALGLQEGGYIVFMGMLGVPTTDALLLSVLSRLSVMAVAIWGGFDYVIKGY